MSPLAVSIAEDLRAHPVQAPWERTVTEVAVSLLTREGLHGLCKAVDAPGGILDPSVPLTPREMSELLVVMENAEADRLVRSRELLKEILAFAIKAAGELLKAALGGLL